MREFSFVVLNVSGLRLRWASGTFSSFQDIASTLQLLSLTFIRSICTLTARLSNHDRSAIDRLDQHLSAIGGFDVNHRTPIFQMWWKRFGLGQLVSGLAHCLWRKNIPSAFSSKKYLAFPPPFPCTMIKIQEFLSPENLKPDCIIIAERHIGAQTAIQAQDISRARPSS